MIKLWSKKWRCTITLNEGEHPQQTGLQERLNEEWKRNMARKVSPGEYINKKAGQADLRTGKGKKRS